MVNFDFDEKKIRFDIKYCETIIRFQEIQKFKSLKKTQILCKINFKKKLTLLSLLNLAKYFNDVAIIFYREWHAPYNWSFIRIPNGLNLTSRFKVVKKIKKLTYLLFQNSHEYILTTMTFLKYRFVRWAKILLENIFSLNG